MRVTGQETGHTLGQGWPTHAGRPSIPNSNYPKIKILNTLLVLYGARTAGTVRAPKEPQTRSPHTEAI